MRAAATFADIITLTIELSGVLGFGILPFSTHTATFRVVPRDGINKFKIISLTAC